MCFKTVPSLYGREAAPVNSLPSGCFWIAAVLLGMRFSLTGIYSDFFAPLVQSLVVYTFLSVCLICLSFVIWGHKMVHVIFLWSCYFWQQCLLAHFRFDNSGVARSFLAQSLAVGL